LPNASIVNIKITTVFFYFMKTIRIIMAGAVFSASLDISSAQVDTEVIKGARTVAPADTVGWERSGYISLLGNQAYFSNWGAGGENAITVSNMFSYSATLQRNKTALAFNADAGYGKSLQQSDKSWRKVDDRVKLSAKYGRKIAGDFYYAGLADFKTQFDNGYDYTNKELKRKTSAAFAPAYLNVALGLDYMRGASVSVFIAPVSSKSTFVLDQELADKGSFGVQPAEYDEAGIRTAEGDRYKHELGGFMRITAKKEIFENVDVSTRLDLFSNYLENAGEVDADWEFMLTMKVNKFLSANLHTHLIYDLDYARADKPADEDIKQHKYPAVQFKELFGVSITYRFR
jgi:hypothetical protein